MKVSPKKSLGQHFLNSLSVLVKIVEAAEIIVGEKILEIGPGTGILTKGLLEKGANVLAVEMDDRSIEYLNQNFSDFISTNQLNVYRGDILALDVSKYFKSSKFAVIANIPYYITGAILQKFLENEPRPNRMVLLVQKEVADRVLARDGKESILSVSVKVFGNPKLIANVPKGAFNPPPTVESAILAISGISGHSFLQNNLLVSRFFEILRAGFAHKRKFAIRNLETVISADKLEKIWHKLSLDAKIRAEDIAVDQWIQIAKLENE